MKQRFLLKMVLVAAGLFMGLNGAWADEATLDPVGVFTWTNTPTITYDGSATSWAINQGGISGGKIGKYAGPYAIVKFDASSVLENKTLLKATLKFDITAGAYNSSLNIAQMADASFDPATVTTATFDATATQFQAGDWSTKNTTTPFAYVVTERVEANNVLAFAIYTNTAREQTLKNVRLDLEYSSTAVAKFNYSLTAVDDNNVDIKTLVSGEEFEGKTIDAYFPYMFYNEGTLYTTSQTPYVVSLDKDNASATVKYAEASSDIVAYIEGEDFNVNSKDNSSYSNGKTGYAGGNKTETIATLPAGKYKATIRLESNGNRSIIIRNKAIADVNTNTIVALPIDKNSAAGIYESDEFTLLEETEIGFSGYTTENKTNQSANIDYLYITKTGDVEVATITAAKYATFVPTVKVAVPDGVTAYYVTNINGNGKARMEEVSVIPANKAVILYKDVNENTQVIFEPTDAAEVILSNILNYSDAETVADGTQYILADGEDGVGFYKAKNTIPARKAYLVSPVGANFLSFSFDDETTGIEKVENAAVNANGTMFNLAGQRVAQPTKGLYIVNGKKVVIK